MWDRLVRLWAPDINRLNDGCELPLCVMWSQPQPISFNATRADKSVPEGTHYASIKSSMNIGECSTLKVNAISSQMKHGVEVFFCFFFAHYSIKQAQSLRRLTAGANIRLYGHFLPHLECNTPHVSSQLDKKYLEGKKATQTTKITPLGARLFTSFWKS